MHGSKVKILKGKLREVSAWESPPLINRKPFLSLLAGVCISPFVLLPFPPFFLHATCYMSFAPCFFPFTTYPEVACACPTCPLVLLSTIVLHVQPHQDHSPTIGIHAVLTAPSVASRTVLWRESSCIFQRGLWGPRSLRT